VLEAVAVPSAQPVATAMLGRVRSDAVIGDLVVRARGGDRSAYAVLYERMRGAVHAVVLARVPHRDAADLVQDTFVAGWMRLDDLRDTAAFPAWILEIARRRAIDHARRGRHAAAGDLASEDEPLEHVGIEPVPRAEAAEALHAIRALPEAYRETMIMRLVEGMTGPEISDATGLTAESVRVNLCRGMKLLRVRLGEGEGARS
jgi:RNA polymerase sigma-70 factor, ECF subfamily